MVSLEVGIVRLMAGIADHAGGVLGGGHLRETLRLSGVFFMAPAAEIGDIGEFRDVADGIVGMLGQRPVTGLAGYVRMFARRPHLGFVLMAKNAGGLAGVGNRPLPYCI